MDFILGLLPHVRARGRAQVRHPARDPDRQRRAVGPRRGALRGALEATGMPYELKAGDGAFYGPKIDFDVTDSIGRSWQLGTIQLDYNAPERFDLTYVGEDNAEHRPVVIHRAVSGSFERFIAILIEHFAGAFPVWLAPEQVRVIPISDAQTEAAPAAHRRLARGRHPGASRRPERDAQLPDPRRRGVEGARTWRWSGSARRTATAWRSGSAGRGRSRRSCPVGGVPRADRGGGADAGARAIAEARVPRSERPGRHRPALGLPATGAGSEGGLSCPRRRPQPERYPVSDSTTPVILSAVRTPIGRYLGGLSGFTAPQLGAMVIRDAVARAGVDAGAIEEVIMGHVVQGGSGQAPARQALIHAGLPPPSPRSRSTRSAAPDSRP